MDRSSRPMRLSAGVALSALILGASSSAKAQSSDAQIKALQIQVEQLTRTVNKLMEAQTKTADDAKAAKKEASQAKAQASQAQAGATHVPVKAGTEELDSHGHRFLEHKKGNPLTFYTPGGEITAYGNFDVSLDYTTKNIKHGLIDPIPTNGDFGMPPVGNFGWMPAISTNLSYLGVRGFQRIGDQPFNFVYQFEAGIDISAFPSNRQSNSNLSNQVNGAVFSRNSYIGVASSSWGALKIGKSDAPYKNSTAMFNPFSGMIGDYSIVMGNTGGDNRVEFGTRIAHAIWYESPVVNGFQFNALFSPGQNRAKDSSNIPSGESDCAGGNDPTSGGLPPFTCSDGSFSNAFSTNLSYTNGPLYITAAYEFHGKVNRSSDIIGTFGLANPLFVQPGGTPVAFGPIGQALYNADVANEDAWKVGALYKFPTQTTVGGIFESMHRHVPAFLNFQNERTRNGTWVFVSQDLTQVDSLHFGWAHAFRAKGDPGQHNSATQAPASLADTCTDPTSAATPCQGFFAPNDNSANMYTVAYKHMFSPNFTWYVDVAATFNGPSAHYDLGAGGRAVTTDCHDATGSSGGAFANPHCWTGTTLLGVSTGAKWTF
jgi:predicted porin/outer membrane murein-binding lipoprotein Lpp